MEVNLRGALWNDKGVAIDPSSEEKSANASGGGAHESHGRRINLTAREVKKEETLCGPPVDREENTITTVLLIRTPATTIGETMPWMMSPGHRTRIHPRPTDEGAIDHDLEEETETQTHTDIAPAPVLLQDMVLHVPTRPGIGGEIGGGDAPIRIDLEIPRHCRKVITLDGIDDIVIGGVVGAEVPTAVNETISILRSGHKFLGMLLQWPEL